jgi:hypothetical protein
VARTVAEVTSDGYVGRRRSAPTYSLRGSLRLVLPLWGGFTALRWGVAVLVVHVVTPSTTFAGTSGLQALVGTWDAGIFLAIAGEGYAIDPDQDPFRAAYFPGWPLAERALAWPLSLVAGRDNGLIAAALVLTTVLSLGASLLLHRIAYEQFGPTAARWALVLFLAWPSAAFLTTLYSESLYLVAAMGAWLLAARERWVLAGLLCGVASFTRVTGVFLGVALAVMYVQTVLRDRERFRWGGLTALLLGGWGVVAYFLWLFIRTGDPLAWSHTQSAGWGRETVAPWSSFSTTWALMTNTELDNADWRWQMVADITIVVMVVALAVVMAQRRYWPELTLTVLTLGSVITSTSYISVTRYTLSIFPLMVLAGSLLARSTVRTKTVIAAVSTVWMTTVMGTFALGYWAG